MRRVLVIVPLLCVAGIAAAAVPTISPAEFPLDDASRTTAHWIYRLLASEIAVMLFGLAYTWVKDYFRDSRWSRVAGIVADAVMETYQSYVRPAKAANGGKLTVAQKNQAVEMALATALAIAKRDGFELLKTMGTESVKSLIERKVSEAKYLGRAPATVAAPLSVSEPPMPSAY